MQTPLLLGILLDTRAKLLCSAIILAICLAISPYLAAQTRVTTWHYQNSRNSVNATETRLTLANVNATTFGKLFSDPVDGFVVGHPLYLPAVSIPGQGTHNVVYLATMNDSVYAFDANTPGAPLWQTSLLTFSGPGATPVPASVPGCVATNRWTQIGVVSTPVINLANSTIYVVAETLENSRVVHRLHALNIATGAEQPGSPVAITAKYVLNGVTYTFMDRYQVNRPGLLLVNNHVYIAMGSPGCDTSARGWVLSYNANTLQQDGTFDVEPGGKFAAIWQKGAGLSADSTGHIYGETGEGTFVSKTNLAMSVFKLTQGTGVITLADWFTPFNWQLLNSNDLDLNDGVLVLPPQPGAHPNEAIGLGKQGTIYLLDRNNMGHICSSTCTTSNTQIIQELKTAVGGESGTPIFFNGKLYFTGGSTVSVFAMNNGLIVTPRTQSGFVATGGHAIITANGNSNAILWNLGQSGVLWAMDAKTLKVLYTSRQAPNGRDTVPPTAHFATPIVADGELFIGTQSTLEVYGLLP